MEKLLTVVVPVYKVEKYINKCLDSLIVPEEQMKLLEIIVVNDGTPDNSAVMAKEYEKRYPETFKVIDKENGGHGSAWNKGVELATGKYLRFLDSDDWLVNFSKFLKKLEKYDVDMVFTGVHQTFEDSSKEDNNFMGISMISDKICEVDKYDWEPTNKIYRGYNLTNFQMCTYRTSIIKQYHPVFLEKMFYDDEILFALPLLSSKTFVYFDQILYVYLLGRSGQTMDPKVMVRNIDFKVKTRKYLVDFCNQHPGQSESIKLKIKYILNSRIRQTLQLAFLLPYKESLKIMREQTAWINAEYPDFEGDKKFAIYKINPTLWWIYCHYGLQIKKYLRKR